MRLAVDFDGTVVAMDQAYDDLATPLALLPFAREGLRALKRAGHQLLLYSARANRALRFNPDLDPLGAPAFADDAARQDYLAFHQRRYQQMVDFVRRELPGVFDAVDDGAGGKPCVDLFIDDKALAYGPGILTAGWERIARTYGEVDYGDAAGAGV